MMGLLDCIFNKIVVRNFQVKCCILTLYLCLYNLWVSKSEINDMALEILVSYTYCVFHYDN